MKNKITIVISLLFCSFTLYSQSLTGREILEEQEARHGAQTEYTVEKMVLVDKSGATENRTLRRYFKEFDENETKTLLTFDSPRSITGTALLTWVYDEGESDQWMFLPAQNRLQRVAKGSKKGYFMGTDFTYEDLESENINNFNYEVIDETQISNLDCWVIKATPNNQETAESSSYKWRILYILKDYFFTIKIEFYDHREVKIKTEQNGSLKRIEGQRFRANKVIMTNHANGHRTIIELTARELDEGLNDNIFTERYVTSGRHLP
ncbi:MAG: outer membrane lipoprotein-sorting protein [Spirochaetales bacterium]|nr:outer membrane lipoprotein-sorting protein [Spirochaetales bacterium]